MTAHSIVYAPIGQATRSEQVIERLTNAIIAGLLEPKEQLPNETELSRLMGVSPMTVREALNTLRIRRLIDTRRGRNGGSFVCEMSSEERQKHHPLRLATAHYLADLGEFHCAVVGHSARLAAQRSTPTEIRRLTQQIDAFAAAVQPEARAQADMRCLLMLAANAQSARLANQELEIQGEWAPLSAGLYQDATIHAEIVAIYRLLETALHEADDLVSCQLAQSMIAVLTDRMLEDKLRIDVESQAR